MLRLFCIFLFAMTGLAAEQVRQVAPLSIPLGAVGDGTVTRLVQLGSRAYFIAENQGLVGLWQTDGTPAGTFEVTLAGASIPVEGLLAVQDTLYFTANNRLGYLTEQSEPVLTDVAVQRRLYDGGNGVFARSRDFMGEPGPFLHYSRTGGLKLYPDLVPEVPGIEPTYSAPVVFNGKVYALIGGYEEKIMLLVSDGTPEGTSVVDTLVTLPDLTSLGLLGMELVVNGGTLFAAANYTIDYVTYHGHVWASEGTPGTTEILEHVETSEYGTVIPNLQVYEDGVVYPVQDGYPTELHVATASGHEVVAASASEFIDYLTVQEGDLLFFNERGFQRLEGKTELTTLIPSLVSRPYVLGKPLRADETGRFHIFLSQGAEYWVSDGTPAGTAFVSQLAVHSQENVMPARVNGHLLFTNILFDHQTSPLVSRASSGAMESLSLNPRLNANSIPMHATQIGDYTIYMDNYKVMSAAADGTIVQLSGQYQASRITTVGDKAFFWVRGHETFEYYLWVTDGTVANTRSMNIGSSLPVAWDMFPSGNLLYLTAYIYDSNRLSITRTDGTPEGTFELGAFDRAYTNQEPSAYADGLGGLYYVQSSEAANKLWFANAQATEMNLLRDIPAYPLNNNDISPVSFHKSAGRAWFNFIDFTDGFPDWNTGSYHVWTSNGTVEGTQLYAGEVAGFENFRETQGMASFTLSFPSGLSGYVLTSGATPFSGFGEQPAYYQIDEFDGRQTGLRYGVSEEHGLWVSDGTAAGTRSLHAELPWFKPHARFDIAIGTVLVLNNVGTFKAYLTDGTPAGTHLLFHEQGQIADVALLDGRLYFTYAAVMSGDLKVYHLTDQGTVEQLPGTESLRVLGELFENENGIHFYATTPDLELNLYAIEKAPLALVFSYKPKFRAQQFYEVSVEPLDGATYAWSTQDGSLFQPKSSPSVLVKLAKNRKATVHLTATLADGQVLEGEVTIQGPDRPSGPVIFLNPAQPGRR